MVNWMSRLGALVFGRPKSLDPSPSPMFLAPWKYTPHANQIPRKVHCLWLTHNSEVMFDQMKQCFARLVALHPDWEIQLHDRHSVEECVRRYPAILPTFENASLIAQCDIGRLAVVGVYGGIYVDLDAMAQRSFNGLFDAYTGHSFIALTEQSMSAPGNKQSTRIANFAFAAKAGDPIIDLCFEYISERLGAQDPPYDRDSDNFVIWSTGPDVISTVIHGLLPEHCIWPVDLPRAIETNVVVVNEKEGRRYIRHGGGGSWRSGR